ncbi:flagellar basal-body MS-ring/collar protein FliF [Neobacillus sp. PS2-9]|uniref:flagellar basal-body MS-ring/collar protein FliF n=1 Tax=Neobacillus sp. PS2-9 TaxID=3070676 RepID=UPI0027E0B9ED|nr:flagellar basal-body MS-ring/collar protein FliF [Neobacillus sp. PS2-9]WML56301.1 flagellar basal-body MS-ring/collar protein FliF [Neobacillus sp. PS2-9]
MKRSWIDQLKHTGELFGSWWNSKSSKQKGLIVGTFLFLLVALSTFIFFASRPQYVPLYTGQLSQREVGDIKAELDKEGYTEYKLSDTGTSIEVPKKDAPDLLVSLASKGYPKDNKINYDIFGQNLSFGATDRQYDILEREAMQNQVAEVIKHVAGIKNAEVIVTLPENSVFVQQGEEQKASASVMVEVEPGAKLSSQQIKALYTLVSRSVPNLPVENITIMNQYSETLALSESDDEDPALDKYDEQRKVQQNVERDIQQDLHSLLGNILGTDKVFVHTFVKMNFDKVKTEEKLVKPTDNNNNGIAISSEKTSKSYNGTGSNPGGVVGTGETDVPGYVGTNSGGESNYEESENRVNYEVNRINNEIIKSPYQIEDITINVGVEPDSPKANTLSKATQDNIKNIVANTVRTALGHPNLSQKEIDQRITVFPHSFAKNTAVESASAQNWLLIGAVAAGGLLLLGGLTWFLLRRRKHKQEEMEEELDFSTSGPVKEADYFAEQDMSVESQLKKLLEQRPEDFSKVIRTWIHEEEV